MPDGNQYMIVQLHREWLVRPETMGSKEKVWCGIGESQSVPHGQWLFKFPQAHTGQHWAERIASKVAARLGAPHATVRLACFEGEKGSICRSFLSAGQGLIHGNELLRARIKGYDTDKKYGQSDHTLDNIWHVLEGLPWGATESVRAKEQFAEYLVLDALVGNTDRHHENWGIVLTVKGALGVSPLRRPSIMPPRWDESCWIRNGIG
ncbi:MAG: HipA domain-containing protein [Bryobacterales bacterium]|nr:HipA domain-containing protein [Bryobacterales bacterium]